MTADRGARSYEIDGKATLSVANSAIAGSGPGCLPSAGAHHGAR